MNEVIPELFCREGATPSRQRIIYRAGTIRGQHNDRPHRDENQIPCSGSGGVAIATGERAGEGEEPLRREIPASPYPGSARGQEQSRRRPRVSEIVPELFCRSLPRGDTPGRGWGDGYDPQPSEVSICSRSPGPSITRAGSRPALGEDRADRPQVPDPPPPPAPNSTESLKSPEDAHNEHDHRYDLKTPDPHDRNEEDLRRTGHVRRDKPRRHTVVTQGRDDLKDHVA
jgi:hypothetical protein